jgi:hypothetical protein
MGPVGFCGQDRLDWLRQEDHRGSLRRPMHSSLPFALGFLFFDYVIAKDES